MNKLYFFIFLTSSLNLAAQAPKFENIKIDIDAPRVSFFDAIEHIEIIRLEETENSLLSEMWSYFKTPSGMGTINQKAHSVVLFNDQGNYKNIIHKYGKGPEEYLTITDVWFNKDKIELFSSQSRSLQHYSEDGKYIATIYVSYPKGISGGSMIPYQSGYLFQQRASYGIGTEVENYGLIFTNKQLNIVGKAAPIVNPNPYPLNLGKRFTFLGKSLFYKKILNDSVYQIIDGVVYPKFKFDFGDQWAWSDPQSTASDQSASRVVGKSDKVIDVLPDIGEKYILLTYYVNINNEQKGYINRETGKFFRFDMGKKDKENYDLKFIQWEDNRLVSSIAAYDFEEFMENLDKDQWTVKGGFSLDEILSSENPILLKIKFK